MMAIDDDEEWLLVLLLVAGQEGNQNRQRKLQEMLAENTIRQVAI